MWVYKIKRNGKLKSRLCVQGCTQIAGIDYHQTFCAAMRSSTLRLLSSAAARLGYGLRRWDFVSAYLQGELLEGEVVYCSLPKGYEEITGRSAIGTDGRPKLVKVVKPIYGMAQAGRRWQRSLFPWLMSKELGFTKSFHDPCVFIKNRKFKDSKGIERVEKLIVGCYVDDLYVIYDVNGQLYSEFTALLTSSWQVDDEG